MKPLSLLFDLLFSFICFGQTVSHTTTLYFPFDSASLTQVAQSEADAFIAAYQKDGSGASITLKGFCDTVGSHLYNDQLSGRRVTTVQRYLLQKGIPANAISLAKGYGKRQPINENLSPEERQLNRRVEISWTTAPPAVTKAPAPAPTEEEIVDTPLFSKALLDTLKEGQTIRLRHINFYGGRHTFLPQARPVLDELLAVMRNNPKLQIEIQGHICCVLSAQDQFDYDAGDSHLSRNRAKAVYDYLKDNGIAASRMSYKGFAGNYPLVYPEKSREDQTLNRRVEIKILRK